MVVEPASSLGLKRIHNLDSMPIEREYRGLPDGGETKALAQRLCDADIRIFVDQLGCA